MKHLDLFSGIGGFALACEWAGIETVCFCEIDDFCCKVLNKHWPNVPIVKDVNDVEGIKRITTHSLESRARKNLSGIRQGIGGIDRGQEPASPHARCLRQEECQEQTAGLEQCDEAITNATSRQPRKPSEQEGRQDTSRRDSIILTAGFPCQPFSNAGRKRGASDDRYLWPQTLAVIKAVQPDWIILENVAGLLNMVFPDSAVGVASQASFCEVPNDEIADYRTISEGIDRDLREAGYETVWLVIPACSLGAPHRRDRVWIVANTKSKGLQGHNRQQAESADAFTGCNERTATSYPSSGRQQEQRTNRQQSENDIKQTSGWGWDSNWYEVATRFCRVDARIPDRLDGFISKDEALRTMQSYYDSAALGERETGQYICQEKVLLKHLLWAMDKESKHNANENCQQKEKPENDTNITELLTMRSDDRATTPPQGQGYQQQLIRELGDFMSGLSPIGTYDRSELGGKCNEKEIRVPAPRIEDRVERLKSLGNAIVPQVAYQIISTIKQVMNMEGI